MGEMIGKWINDLLNSGVSGEHIEEMKRIKMRSSSSYEYYYDEVRREELPTLIDTNKIVGIDTAWSTAGKTVYDLFFSVTGEIPAKETLNYNRIKENLDSLIVNGLSYQYKFYTDKSVEYRLRDGLPKFIYFKEDDIYFSRATHRTISALMFNAPQMIGYVTTYCKNQTKFENYSIYKQVRDRWFECIKNELANIEIIKLRGDKNRVEHRHTYSLKFIEYPEIELMRIDVPEPSKQDFLDSDTIINFKESVFQIIDKVKLIDKEAETQWFKKIKELPVSFSILKKCKCLVLYDLLYDIKFPKRQVYISFDQPLESIIEKIKYNLLSHTIYKNKPIKGS
jgi:hypothetical protein